MIILQDLFNTLATGVFSNTSFRGTDNLLKEEHYSKISNSINLGMIEIYKRFKLLENELKLHITPDVTSYVLRSDRVAPLVSISTSKYIESTADVDGFLNIIKITDIYNSDGDSIRPNSRYNYGVDIPIVVETAPDVISVTNFSAAQVLTIKYQSYPNKITESAYDFPEAYQLNIPDTILDPLILYVAAKSFKPTGSNDSTANADKSASYEQQYELACQKLLLYGLTVQDSEDRDSFASNGWV